MTSDKPTNVRYFVIGATALMSVLLYLDRFCISFAGGFIKDDLGLDDQQIGWMLGAFFWTYALCQVPAGWFSDRFGARPMLTVYILGWSLFTGLTGAAAAFAALLLLRLGFGIAQAGAYPTAASVVSKWVPFDLRGTASSIVAVGGRVGGVLAFYATGLVIVFLTPVSTPAIFSAADLIDPPKVCYELNSGESPAAKKVLASFSESEREIVTRHAGAYQEELDRIESLKPAGQAADTFAGKLAAFRDRLWKTFFEDQEEVKLQVDPLAPDEVTQLATAMNRVVDSPNFFTQDDLGELSVEKEVGRLLNKADRDQQQDSRLNRLMIEALHDKSVKRLYGTGWRPMMWLYGAIGILVAGLFWWTSRNRPKEHPWCNEAEIDLIENDPRMTSHGRGKVGGVPWGNLLRSCSMWLCCASQWFTNIGWVFIVTWAPTYFEDVHQIRVEQLAVMVAIPPMIGWFGMLSGGVLTDRLVNIVGVRWGRALPMSLTRFLAMSAYIVCLFNPSPWLAVGMFSLVAFATDMGTPSVWAFNQDVGGRHAASILGWGNMFGNLGAAITPPLLIAVVGQGDARDWDFAFMTCAAAFLISGICAIGVNATVPIAPVEEDEKA